MRKVYFLAYLLLVSQFVIAQNYAMPLITSKDVIFSHKGFVINYDKSTKNARWVAYTLIGKELQTKIKRNNNFMSDPFYPQSASNKDYVKSGYDKGHLFPAGSACDSTVMRESFYFTNISPQIPSFNRGVWNKIEQKVRGWAMEYDTLYVITGCVVDSLSTKIGNQVAVPSYFYKLILVYTSKVNKAIVFYLKNEKADTNNISDHVMSVKQLENILKVDFCVSIPDSIENKIESNLDKQKWKW